VELAVSRALGDFFAKQPDVRSGLIAIPFIHPTIQIEDNDSFLVVASDGLWDIFTGQQVIDMVIEKVQTVGAGSGIARFLIERAMEAQECHDNITCIVVFL
jgi:protein phosphatase PTC2/3